MQFNADKFDRAEMKPRTKRVPVEALADFFTLEADEKPMWEVRGLSATELHRAIEAGKRQSSVEAIIKAIAASGDQTQAVRKALGLTTDTPGEIAKRLELLVLGSVAPAIELPTAVKLAERFPIEFMQLTNEIGELTGLGFDLVKPRAASQTTTA
jgi:hypothetical protein